MFSATRVSTGTATGQAHSRGVIIDLTGDDAWGVSND
jgi:hypothetical protein